MNQTTKKTAYTKTLADFVSQTKYEDIPPETVHTAKRLVLDFAANSLGAATIDMGKAVVKSARHIGGENGEATVIGHNLKTSSMGAAFINGELGNVMDADGGFAQTHPQPSAVAAALAVAEQVGASGKDFLTAVILGFDVTTRIHLTLPRDWRVVGTPPNLNLERPRNNDWAPHVFGAAAAASKLLDFNSSQTANTFGIAGVNAPINTTMSIMGYASFLPMTKYSCLGVDAMIGVMAAVLTQNGFTASSAILDSEYGFYYLLGIDQCYPEQISEQLGEKWWIHSHGFKMYPHCRIPHPAMDALCDIMANNNLKPDDIEKIVYWVHPRSVGMFDLWPVDSVHDSVTSTFCFPMGLAMAAYGIEPGPEWLAIENIEAPMIKAFARKVEMVGDPHALELAYEMNRNESRPFNMHPTKIEVTTKGGRTISEIRENAKPLSDEDLKSKTRSYAKKVLSPKKINDLIDVAFKLDELDDIHAFTSLLVP